MHSGNNKRLITLCFLSSSTTCRSKSLGPSTRDLDRAQKPVLPVQYSFFETIRKSDEGEEEEEGSVEKVSKLSTSKSSRFSRCFPCLSKKKQPKMVVIEEKPFLSGVIEGKLIENWCL